MGLFLLVSPSVSADAPNEWMIFVNGSSYEPSVKINGINSLDVSHNVTEKKHKTIHTYAAVTTDGFPELGLRIVERTKLVKVNGVKAPRTTYDFEKAAYEGKWKSIKKNPRLIITEFPDGHVTQLYKTNTLSRMVEYFPEEDVSFVYDWSSGKLYKSGELPGYHSLMMGTQSGIMYGSTPQVDELG